MGTFTVIIQIQDGSILGDRLHYTNYDGGGRVRWLQPEKYTPTNFEYFNVMINMPDIPHHLVETSYTLQELHATADFKYLHHTPVIAFMHLNWNEKFVARDFHPWNLTVSRNDDDYEDRIFIGIRGTPVVFSSRYGVELLQELDVGDLLHPFKCRRC
ncbi:uncharacterized protein LOC117168243 [Belonocnema kinseyi]|uniref:uncharacterized protein LOC117168243 n=1 Tax=Belonocnema kinseyi TaxID=2817044 RepID=UPI00143CE32B|nr:uncharacterized protein LOC117168243 [Belonocnema kinseyi]